MREIGLYIHIPFCKSKCNYCDFISYANQEEMQEKYIKALIKEIEKECIKEFIIDTIYIGGGTPSYVDSQYIVEILKNINKNCNIKKGAEITIEINPGTVNIKKINDYKKAGINRISIGLQATNNELLKSIGRIHTFEDFLESHKIISEAGFENINIDLMLGLPKQTLNMLEESLNKVIKLNPKHISVYSLILEEGTKLYKDVQNGNLKIPEDEFERKMYWLVKNKLESNGYNHYEISNFAKKGFESRHNSNCWEQKEYIGIGLAAHSYINNKRYSNTDSLEKYIENYKKYQKIHEVQKVEDKKKEYMLLGLRKIEGINIQKFKNKFSENPIYVFKKELNKLVKEGLIEVDLNNIKLTNKGIDLGNKVWQEFV